MVLLWSVLLSTTSTGHHSFSKHFFSYCFCMLSEFAKVYERKVWHVRVAHLHNAGHALSSPSQQILSKISLILWYLMKANRMWFSVVCSLMDNDTRHHSGQNVVDSDLAALRESTTFWPLWWRLSLSIRVHTMLNLLASTLNGISSA